MRATRLAGVAQLASIFLFRIDKSQSICSQSHLSLHPTGLLQAPQQLLWQTGPRSCASAGPLHCELPPPALTAAVNFPRVPLGAPMSVLPMHPGGCRSKLMTDQPCCVHLNPAIEARRLLSQGLGLALPRQQRAAACDWSGACILRRWQCAQRTRDWATHCTVHFDIVMPLYTATCLLLLYQQQSCAPEQHAAETHHSGNPTTPA
jgi:hypothetical protein